MKKTGGLTSLQRCGGIPFKSCSQPSSSIAFAGRNTFGRSTSILPVTKSTRDVAGGIGLYVTATSTSAKSMLFVSRGTATMGRLFQTHTKSIRTAANTTTRSKKELIGLTRSASTLTTMSGLASIGGLALTVVCGRQLLKLVLPRIGCLDNGCAHNFEMDRFFQFSNVMAVNAQSLADAVQRNKASYGWCVTIANWGKYLFGLGLALVGSFGLWYASTFQRAMADRLWPAFVFGAIPMLAVGYIGRVAAAFFFMGAAGYGYFATMNYWEGEIVSRSCNPLTGLLVDKADLVKDFVGDWGNNLKPHLTETYEITTPLLHFSSDPKQADFPRASNGFVFVLTGSSGQALVRVITELNFADKRQYEQQVADFFDQVDDYSYAILSFLQPFASAPGPYPSIPQFQMKGVDLHYVDIVCVAGPKRGERSVLVDNMHILRHVKPFIDLHENRGDKKEENEKEKPTNKSKTARRS